MLLSEEDKKYLATYRPGDYERPSVTVDMLIFTIGSTGQLELLMIRRGGHPYKGGWAIPGGFVNMNESVDAAAERELFEETGVSGLHLEQLYTFGAVDRDPRMRVISVAYMSLVPKDSICAKAGDDASDAAWIAVSLEEDGAENKVVFADDIPVAFDHDEIIRLGIERLRGKLSYTNIAFKLLSNRSRFTIYELQKVHEAILGRKLDTANFRRAFINNYVEKELVEDTGEKCVDNGSRPSRYYRVINEELL